MSSRPELRSALMMTAIAIAAVATFPVRGQSDCSHQYGLSEPRPRVEGTIRLATYNMLNMFDRDDDPALTGEQDDMQHALSTERGKRLAATIREIDADVIALQEIESLEAVRWFRDTFIADMGYEHLASEDVGYFRGVECSVMSRFPITNVTVWPNASLNDVRREGVGWSDVPGGATLHFRRSPIMVDIQVAPDYAITVVALHHKSGSSFSYQREAEALRVLELIGERTTADPGRNVIVMGDFNAAPWDKSFRIYLESGFVDLQAHRNLRGPEAPLFKSHESDRVLDYVLMNGAAYLEYVIGSVFIYGGELSPPESYDWRTDPFPRGYASDHYPLVFDIVPKDRS